MFNKLWNGDTSDYPSINVNITKLDAEIIRTFIERVYIYNADATAGRKIKKIKIIFNFIGEINLTTENKQ